MITYIESIEKFFFFDTYKVLSYFQNKGGEYSMTRVAVRDGESIERALKRFKRKVEQSGVLKEVRKREYFIKPSMKKKVKARNAESRARKREKKVVPKGAS